MPKVGQVRHEKGRTVKSYHQQDLLSVCDGSQGTECQIVEGLDNFQKNPPPLF